MRNTSFLAILAAALALGFSSSGQAQQRSVGTIAGDFDVSNSGSARYSIPLRVSPGTAGTAPDLSITYDSQATGGVLGAGWSLGGISAITRGPRNLYSDGVVDGIRLSGTDALFLDGQKLVQVAVSGAGAALRVEYRKETDDVSRVIRIGADDKNARFIVQTKGGVTLIFDGSNGSAISTADGGILLWGISRIVDSTGNFIEFRYAQNGQGEHKVASILYTGHGALDANGILTQDQAPYASVDFDYEDVTRPIDAYVAGRLVRRTARLKSITSRVGQPGTAATTWTIAGRYAFDYEDRDTANRFVLSAVHQFGDDGSELEPTSFKYSEPNTGWRDAGFQLPVAVLAVEEKFGGGFHFAHFSETGTQKDLLFSALIDGKLEAYAFRNNGGTWTNLDDYKPPFAFVSGDGSDLGALVADINGDGRVDLIQSTRNAAGDVSRSAYVANKDKWLRTGGYDLPFDLSRSGKRTAIVLTARFSGSARADMIYEADGVRGFLANTGTGWQVDSAHAPPLPLSASSRVIDADCDGRPDILVEAGGTWRVYRFDSLGWMELNGAFVPGLLPGIAPDAVVLVDINADQCLDIVVASAKANFRKTFVASTVGFSESQIFAPPFDLTNSDDVSSGAQLVDLDGDLKLDIIAHRRDAIGPGVEFAYLQSAAGWTSRPAGATIPLIYDLSDPDNPIIAQIVDLDGDGNDDIARPTGRRGGFGRVYVNAGAGAGFVEKPHFAPDIAFARQDQQDRGIRFVDLNGDGLQDVIFRRDFSKDGKSQSVAGAFINSGTGWREAKGLEPPEPFAAETLAGNPAQLFDVDLDGYVDLLYSYQAVDGTRINKYYRNVPDGDVRKWADQAGSPMILPALHPVAAEASGDQGVRFIDLNGDGRVDMLVGAMKAPTVNASEKAETCATGADGKERCTLNRELFEGTAFLNDGKGWTEVPGYAPPIPFVARGSSSSAAMTDLFVQLVDVDGDRLPDLVARFKHPRDPAVEVSEIWHNTGKGWILSATKVPVALDTPLRNSRALLQWLDVNADGLADLVYSERQGSANSSKTWLSTGQGFADTAAWKIPVEAIADRGGDPSYRLVDLNGDGWLDIFYSRRKDAAAIERGVYFNNGSTWVAAAEDKVAAIPALIDENSLDLGVRLLDVDGNGLLDVVKSYARGGSGDTAERLILLNTGRRSDVLYRIDQGFGRSIGVTYQTLLEAEPPDGLTSAAPWEKVYTVPSGQENYPLVAPVPTAYVVRRNVTTAAGTSVAVSHRYGDYRMHMGAMRSVGYGWRETFNETSSLLTRTEFSQKIETAGRPMREATCWVKMAKRPASAAFEASLCPSQALPPWIVALGEIRSDWQSQSQSVPGLFPAAKITQTFLRSTTASVFELDGRLVSRETTHLTYDQPFDLLQRHMNVLLTEVTRIDGTSIVTTNVYDGDDPGKWHLGRVTSTIVRRVGDVPKAGGPRSTETREVAYRYDPVTGLVVSSTMQPGDPRAVTISYSRDKFGNITAKTLSAPGEQPRTSNAGYDQYGRFVVSETNAELHTSSYTRFATSGLIDTAIDPNNLTTRFAYDGFGRLKSSTAPNGVVSLTVRVFASNVLHTEGLQAAFAERSKTGDLPEEIRLFDANARLIRIVREGFTLNDKILRPVYTDMIYDAQGRLVKASLPYDRGTSPLWQTTDFDAVGRAIAQTGPDGKRIQTLYAGRAGGGRVTTAIDAKGRRTVAELNTRGLIVSVMDPAFGRATYGYDAGDRKVLVVGASGASSTSRYDVFGLRHSTTDANRGTWAYDYNAFGQLVRQKDANGQITTLEYDKIGRLRRRSIGASTVEWIYDTAAHGVGQLKGIRDPNRFEKTFFYDTLGRAERLDVTIGTETFSTVQEFDKYGRLEKVRYPGSGAQPMVVENSYDAKGYFTRVTSEGGATLYWQVLDVDAQSRVTKETYGNGVIGTVGYDAATGQTIAIAARTAGDSPILDLALQYDDLGNLKRREEKVRGVNEAYDYDALDRLRAITNTDGSKLFMGYDAGGRIREKGDVGSYSYRSDAPGPWAPFDAVVQTSRNGVNKEYRYDANGNATQGAGRNYAFTPDNRLQKVTVDAMHWVQFDYGPNGDRYRQLTRDGNAAYETLYAGMFERLSEMSAAAVGPAKKQRYRYFLTNPNGTFAVIETVVVPGASVPPITRVWYLHRDQLGSIVRVTDEKGELAVRYWYDPWGRRTGVFVESAAADLGKTWARGFTGHEHLIGVELIHMNGRVYDAQTGMFLSADPVEPGVGSQALNRFAYALNNPFRYTDPTGYWSWGRAALGAVVGFVTGGPGGAVAGFVLGGHDETREWIQQNWREVAVAAVAVGITVASGGTLGPVLAGMAAGAASGGLHAALYGGSFDDVLAGAVKGGVVGAISGAAFYGVGEAFSGAAGSIGSPDSVGAILAHGTVGGTMSAADGGDFWTGFSAAAFTKASSAYGPNFRSYGANVARAAVVGGTASSISGGKFANGALIGAFSYAYNDALHDPNAMPSDVLEIKAQVNLGSSVGIGAKVFDVFGNPKLGASAELGGFGVDYIPGEKNPSFSYGPPLPCGRLCSVSFSPRYHNYTVGGSAQVRVMSVEVSVSFDVNMARTYQWVESSIYRIYSVPQY